MKWVLVALTLSFWNQDVVKTTEIATFSTEAQCRSARESMGQYNLSKYVCSEVKK